MFDEKFWIAISFLLLIVFLYKKLSSMVAEALDNKSSEVEDQLRKASLLKVEAQEIRDSYLRQKKENTVKSQKILDNAERQAKHLISEGETELNKIIEQKFKQAEILIKEQEKIAIDTIRITAIEQSVKKFKKFIAEENSYKKELYGSSIDLLKKAI